MQLQLSAKCENESNGSKSSFLKNYFQNLIQSDITSFTDSFLALLKVVTVYLFIFIIYGWMRWSLLVNDDKIQACVSKLFIKSNLSLLETFCS